MKDPTNPFQERGEVQRAVSDERRGRDANLAGKPFDPSQNIDWQRGWQNAEDDRRLELEDDDD